MLYSVAFTEKDGKKYYRKHREKYHLEDESAVLKTVPSDTSDRMQFYYYEDSSRWIFDSESYDSYISEKKEQQEQEQNTDNTSITQEEILAAMMELAQNQSDLEDAIVEVAAVIGGE